MLFLYNGLMNKTQSVKELFYKSVSNLESIVLKSKNGPLKKPYKDDFTPENYAYGYPVLPHPKYHIDDTLDDYLKENTDVAGMATGQLDGEKGEGRAIVLNPYQIYYDANPDSSWFKTVTKLEGSRHVMDEEGFKPSFEITPEMQKMREKLFPEGQPYREDDDAYRKTMISRYVAGDYDSIPLPDTDEFMEDVRKVQKMMDERENKEKTGNK